MRRRIYAKIHTIEVACLSRARAEPKLLLKTFKHLPHDTRIKLFGFTALKSPKQTQESHNEQNHHHHYSAANKRGFQSKTYLDHSVLSSAIFLSSVNFWLNFVVYQH